MIPPFPDSGAPHKKPSTSPSLCFVHWYRSWRDRMRPRILSFAGAKCAPYRRCLWFWMDFGVCFSPKSQQKKKKYSWLFFTALCSRARKKFMQTWCSTFPPRCTFLSSCRIPNVRRTKRVFFVLFNSMQHSNTVLESPVDINDTLKEPYTKWGTTRCHRFAVCPGWAPHKLVPGLSSPPSASLHFYSIPFWCYHLYLVPSIRHCDPYFTFTLRLTV